MIRGILILFTLVFLSNLWGKNPVDYSKYGIDTTKGSPKGLQVGERAPSFTAKNLLTGTNVSLTKTIKNHPVILLFYRGSWCPVCKRYLSEFADSLKDIEKTNAKVFVISMEKEQYVLEMQNKTGLHKAQSKSLVLISDTTGAISEKYGVQFYVTSWYDTKVRVGTFSNIAKRSGKDEAKLPIPATYIIGQDGIIKARYFSPNYKNRASVSWMIKEINKLK